MDINKNTSIGDLAKQWQMLAKEANRAILTHQVPLLSLEAQLTALAKSVQEHCHPQVSVFLSFEQKLQPIILQQTKYAKDFSGIFTHVTPMLDAVKTLYSFNAFQRYQETFKEFGGDFDPEDITEDEIEQTIEENSYILGGINEIVIKAENDGITPGDIPGLIYSYLLEVVPKLSKKTYGIIVLIFCTVVFFYQISSTYSTNKILDETVAPKFEEQSEKLDELSNKSNEIHKDFSNLSNSLYETNLKLDNSNMAIDSLEEKINSLHEIATI